MDFKNESIELANQRNYLDLLYRIYTTQPGALRDISDKTWERIQNSFNGKDNVELIKACFGFSVFPIKDSYVSYLKRDPTAFDRNPQTVARIAAQLRQLGLDKLYERGTQPPEPNRQMGQRFREWVNNGNLGPFPVSLPEFESSNDDAILRGSDKELLNYAVNKLGYKTGRKKEKSPDLIARFNGKYVIGEAKFLSDYGGNQNNQIEDAFEVLDSQHIPGVVTVAILDGVLYIKPKPGNEGGQLYAKMMETQGNIMSVLYLSQFLPTI